MKRHMRAHRARNDVTSIRAPVHNPSDDKKAAY